MPDIIEDWDYGVAWSEKLETGHEEIDNQHRHLFKLTSDIIDSCQKNDHNVSVEETLLFLEDYVVLHFKDEEKLSRESNYPHYAEHKKLHDDFKKTVGVFIGQYREESDNEALMSIVTKEIGRWLITHIRLEDVKIAEHIKETENK